MSDRAEVGSWLTNQLGYLEQLRSVTDELMKKLPAQTLVDEVASRVGLAGLPKTDQNERRLRNNIKALISELLAEV